MSPSTLIAALCALLIVNLWTVLRFRSDKNRAVRGERRIPESHLLFLSAAGGTPGAFFARHRFRHKTRKQPFSTGLWLIAVMQVGALIGFAWPK
ncbi:MAG: DUF1294 domain-containing protein [Pseudomonadota bacterium]